MLTPVNVTRSSRYTNHVSFLFFYHDYYVKTKINISFQMVNTARFETEGLISYGSSDFLPNDRNSDSLRKNSTFEKTDSSLNLTSNKSQANQASEKEKIAELEDILAQTKSEINRKLKMLKDSELKMQLEG
jgi:hypothetical protein